ncbi:hypothetical protein RhiJN_26286 [Ceratobasidium sp. AG-Ba]|nr:hypothetical protein RhiJN_26286 [Ceratobasidium sp. AG-Ba]
MSDGNAEQTPPVQTGPPAAADTPRYTLTSEQLEWLHRNHYQAFKLAKGNRGTKKNSKRALSLLENQYANGKDFSDRVVVPAFVKQFHSQWDNATVETWKASLEKASVNTSHMTLISTDRDSRKSVPLTWFLSAISFAIYARYRLVRRDGEHKTKQEAANHQKGSASHPKRVYPENEWARANPSLVSEEIKTRTGSSSGSGNITEAKRVNQVALARLPVEERASFVNNTFLKEVRRLANHANVVAGISFTMTFTYEAVEDDGQASHRIEGYTSPSIQDWATTEEYGDHIAQFSSWARLEKGVTVAGQSPAIATIPDVENLYRPMYPHEANENLGSHVVRTMNRQFLIAEYSFYGGNGSLPWKEISDAYTKGEITQWIHNWPEGVPFDELTRISYEGNVELFRVLRRRQDGAPPDSWLWFSQVYAGTTLPRGNQDSCSRDSIVRRGHIVFRLQFDKPVSRPQSDRPVVYKTESWRYLHHSTAQRSLEHWLSLPCIAYDPSSELMRTEVFNLVRSVLDGTDKRLSDQIVNFLARINEIQRHGPFSPELGIWGISDSVESTPKVLPVSKPSNVPEYLVVFMQEFWPNKSYALSSYDATKAGYPHSATFEFFLTWIDSLLSGGLFHTRSNTLLGGDAGYVWVGLSLVRFVLVTSVATLGAKYHLPPPDGFDVARLGYEHQKLLAYFNRLDEYSKESLITLSKSSSERVQIADQALLDLEADDAPRFDAVPTDEEDQTTTTTDAIPSTALGSTKGKKTTSAPQAARSRSNASTGKPSERGQPTGGSTRRRGDPSGNPDESTSRKAPREDDSSKDAQIDISWFEPRPLNQDFAPRKNAFGPFAPQPEVPDHPGTAQDMFVDVHKCLNTLQPALRAWDRFDGPFVPYPVPVIKAAELLSQSFPHPILRELFEGILLHRYLWNRSRLLWPEVVKLATPILQAARMLASLLKSMKALVDDRPNGPIKKKLEQTCTDATRGLIQCRAVVESLVRFEELSTRTANLLQDAWDGDVRSWGVEQVMKLGYGLAAWRNASDQLAYDLEQEFRQLVWIHELDLRLNNIHYRVGCPDSAIYVGQANGPYDALLAMTATNDKAEIQIASPDTNERMVDVPADVEPRNDLNSNPASEQETRTVGPGPQATTIGPDETTSVLPQPLPDSPSIPDAVPDLVAPPLTSLASPLQPDGEGPSGVGIEGGTTEESGLSAARSGETANEQPGSKETGAGAANSDAGDKNGDGVEGPTPEKKPLRRSGRLSTVAQGVQAAAERKGQPGRSQGANIKGKGKAKAKRKKEEESEEEPEGDDLEAYRMQKQFESSGASGSAGEGQGPDGESGKEDVVGKTSASRPKRSTGAAGSKRARFE